MSDWKRVSAQEFFKEMSDKNALDDCSVEGNFPFQSSSTFKTPTGSECGRIINFLPQGLAHPMASNHFVRA